MDVWLYNSVSQIASRVPSVYTYRCLVDSKGSVLVPAVPAWLGEGWTQLVSFPHQLLVRPEALETGRLKDPESGWKSAGETVLGKKV